MADDINRIAYEEGIRWLAELDSMLERYRTRATAYLATAIVAGGIGSSGLDPKEPPHFMWFILLGAGIVAALVAAIVLTWGVRGQFRLDPERIVTLYGPFAEQDATKDLALKDLALHLASNTSALYRVIDQRRKWLYVSMGGACAVLIGIVGLRMSQVY